MGRDGRKEKGVSNSKVDRLSYISNGALLENVKSQVRTGHPKKKVYVVAKS